jgi:hypothetical protein
MQQMLLHSSPVNPPSYALRFPGREMYRDATGRKNRENEITKNLVED